MAELSRLFHAYAEGSSLECIAMKAVTVFSMLVLQKPSRNSKAKDHSACLIRRMCAWHEVDINTLVLEGRCLQQRLPKTDHPERDEKNLVHTFSKMMFSGKIGAAIQLLSEKGKGGILHAKDPVDRDDHNSPTVLEVLKYHPLAQVATSDALTNLTRCLQRFTPLSMTE